MAPSKEIEIKFWIDHPRVLQQAARAARFRLVTKPTHEFNTLYDLPGNPLRRRGEVLRLRRYGKSWLFTHKARAVSGRHKSRVETQTAVEDGASMHAILTGLKFRPVFRYEKFRSEWTDGTGHLVMDRTPVGNIAELEGPPGWIDRTAKLLGVGRKDYVTKSYSEVFFDWKKKTGSRAADMTFDEVRKHPGRKVNP